MRKVNKKYLAIYIFVSLFLGAFAHAGTWHTDRPGNAITAQDAYAQAVDHTVFKCDEKTVGPNGNPVKLKGSQASFHASVPETVKDFATQLASGKSMIFCESMILNKSTGRLMRAK